MQIIRLEFVRFDVQFSDTCSYDKVSVYDSDNSSTLLGTYCGSMLPGDVISGSNSLFVTFETDRTLAGSGFEIKYDAIELQTREYENIYIPFRSLQQFGLVINNYKAVMKLY